MTARIELVDRHGGTHHGYFLPAEGASDVALALFSFPSLGDYEVYRPRFGEDPEFVEADRIRDESGCVVRYDRTFMRPLLPGDAASAQTERDESAQVDDRDGREKKRPEGGFGAVVVQSSTPRRAIRTLIPRRCGYLRQRGWS